MDALVVAPVDLTHSNNSNYIDVAIGHKVGSEEFYTVNYDFVAQEANKITCLKGEKVKLIRRVNGDWWIIQNNLGAQGEVPAKQLIHYDPSLEQEPKSSEPSTFKRVASRVLLRNHSVKGLKTPQKTPKTKQKPKTPNMTRDKDPQNDDVTPDNISNGVTPLIGESRSRWGFVKNKLKREKSSSPASSKISQERQKTDKKVSDKTPTDKKVSDKTPVDKQVSDNTPAKPPRRQHFSAEEEKNADKPISRKKTRDNARDQETLDLPRDTPRSDCSFNANDSCVWDPYTPGLKTDIMPERDTVNSVVPVVTTDDMVTVGMSSEELDMVKGVAMVTEDDILPITTQSSVDTDTFSEVFDSLPDPPDTFSSKTKDTTQADPLAVSPGMRSSIISQHQTGSTLTVVQIPSECSEDDLVSLPATDNEILDNNELNEILYSTPTKSKDHKLLQRQLSSTPDPPTGFNPRSTPGTPIIKKPNSPSCVRTPRSPHTNSPGRKPRTVSNVSDLSSILSEAPSLSGNKSGIHYFKKPDLDNPEDTASQPEVLDTPRLHHMIKSDPTFNAIIDDGFFDLSSCDFIGDEEMDPSKSEQKVAPAEGGNTENSIDKHHGNKPTSSRNHGAIDHHGDELVADEAPSLGSHPKWDIVAKNVKERRKREKDDKEQTEPKFKKKSAWNKIIRNRKEPKERRPSAEVSFVKKKEFDVSTATLNSTNTSTNTLTNITSDFSSSPNQENTISISTSTPQKYEAPTSTGTIPTIPNQIVKEIKPPTRKKKLQRQATILEDTSSRENTNDKSEETNTLSILEDSTTDHTTISEPYCTDMLPSTAPPLIESEQHPDSQPTHPPPTRPTTQYRISDLTSHASHVATVPILHVSTTESVPPLQAMGCGIRSRNSSDAEERAVIEFRRSSFDLSKPSDMRDLLKAQRLSASESEIFELLTPNSDINYTGEDPLQEVTSTIIATIDPEDTVTKVLHMTQHHPDGSPGSHGDQSRDSGSQSRGSSDTHVTQDTPSNDEEYDPDKYEDEIPKVVEEEIPQTLLSRPSTPTVVEEEIPQTLLSRPSTLIIPDDKMLDMSADNTLSFVFTHPPKHSALTVNVNGNSTVKVCRTPEKKKIGGTSDEQGGICTDSGLQVDEVFTDNTPAQHGDHDDSYHGDSDQQDDLVTEMPESTFYKGITTFLHSDTTVIGSGGTKRKSESPVHDMPHIDPLPSPQISPEKLIPAPKIPRTSGDLSPRRIEQYETVPMLFIRSPSGSTPTLDVPVVDSVRLASPSVFNDHPQVIRSQYEELHISPRSLSSRGKAPLVDSLRVISEDHVIDEEEMSRGKKIRKQLSVYCDGKENERVETSHDNRRKETRSGEDTGVVETDSAMRYAEPTPYGRLPGDNVLNPDKQYKQFNKAHSHPPTQSHNIMSLVDNQPPSSAPPVCPSAPLVSPQPSFMTQEPVLYAEPSSIRSYHPSTETHDVTVHVPHDTAQPSCLPPPLPEKIRQKFGESNCYPDYGNHHTRAGYERSQVDYQKHSPIYEAQISTEAPYNPSTEAQKLYPTLPSDTNEREKPKLSGTSDNDEVILTDRTNQSCSVQTRNMSINTDPLKCNHFGNFRADPKKSSSILYHVKKTLGIGKTRKKMRDNIDVKQEKTRVTCTAAEVTEQAYTSHITPNRNTAPEQKTPTRPKVQTTPIRTPQASSPHVVQTTVTAHVVSPTAPPHATPDPPSPCPSAPEEDSIQYEPETKPTKQGLYPHLSSTDYPAQHPTPQLTPQHGGAMFSQQIFGTHPGAPPPFPTAGMMPGGGMMPNVPFMWFPYGVPFTPTTGHMPSIREEHHVKRKKGGTLQPHEHNCIDPTLLSKDLIRHVKRSCGLDKTRSRIAARAIIQCLEDSISETVKIQLLSEILTAMDNSYRSRREEKDSDQRVVSRRKRNRPDEVNDEEPTVRTSRKHRCKRAVKEEKVLMEYLQHVLEILESMSEGPGKENSFHMYYNLANQLLDTMYTKLSSRAANDYDIS